MDKLKTLEQFVRFPPGKGTVSYLSPYVGLYTNIYPQEYNFV